MKNSKTIRSQKVNQSLLINRAKTAISQKILSGAALLFIGLMLFNTAKMTMAGNSNTSNLNLSVTAGDLGLMNVDANVQFAATQQGTAANVTQNLNGTTVVDWRSTANFFWDLKMYSDPLTGQTDSNYVVASTLLSVFTGSAIITSVNAFDNTKVGTGPSNNTSLETDHVVFNAEDTSGGVVRFDDVLLKANLNASLIGQQYKGNLTVTVVAS